MPVSQNGWSANDRSVIASYALPGGAIALRKGDVSVVLLFGIGWWHSKVEKLIFPGVWGYAERPVRGQVLILSNHASGTAADVDAPKHPLGTDPRSNFTQQQINEINALIAFCTTRAGKQVLRWGGNYTGRKDGMHLEINDGVTLADLAEIAEKIRLASGVVGGKPLAAPAAVSYRGDMHGLPALSRGSSHPACKKWQEWYNGYNFQPALLPLIRPTNDAFGPQTEAAVRKFQQRYGLAVDGVMGAQTIGKSYELGWRW
jgi:peptidoglycan hydrolase-like protein with peptidoglycan-binding domain